VQKYNFFLELTKYWIENHLNVTRHASRVTFLPFFAVGGIAKDFPDAVGEITDWRALFRTLKGRKSSKKHRKSQKNDGKTGSERFS